MTTLYSCSLIWQYINSTFHQYAHTVQLCVWMATKMKMTVPQGRQKRFYRKETMLAKGELELDKD